MDCHSCGQKSKKYIVYDDNSIKCENCYIEAFSGWPFDMIAENLFPAVIFADEDCLVLVSGKNDKQFYCEIKYNGTHLYEWDFDIVGDNHLIMQSGIIVDEVKSCCGKHIIPTDMIRTLLKPLKTVPRIIIQ